MKIEIKKGNQNFIINLNKITQLIGTSFDKKSYIIDSIIKHFTNAKYQDFEDEKIDNIMLDDKIINRKYFETYTINNRENLIDNISIGKATLTFKYINTIINDFEYQNNINDIDQSLLKIYSNLNQCINKTIDNIKIDYIHNDLINLVAKSEVLSIENNPIYTMSTLSLLITYIQLLTKLYEYNNKKMLIIIQNIDQLLPKDQYGLFIKKSISITKDKEIYLLFTSSISNYVYVSKNTLTGINVINDTIFNMPNIDSIYDFIERTYPTNINIEENDIYNILSQMLNEVGNESHEINLKKLIFLHLFNKTLSIDTKITYKINNSELSLINF